MKSSFEGGGDYKDEDEKRRERKCQSLLSTSCESHEGRAEGQDQTRSDFDNVFGNDKDQRAAKRESTKSQFTSLEK